jgi:predicted ribosome quality control (RQC) complex YloA/Tae2 family protein
LKIIDAIKRVYPEMSAVRQILPGIPYTLPPQNIGLAPVIESEIESGVSRDTLDELANEGKYSPSIWVDESSGKLRDFHVFDLSVYRELIKESFEDTDSMLQSWFARRDVYSRLTVKSADLSQTINTRLSKALLKRQRLGEDLVKAADADSYRLKGELLTANLYKITKGATEITLDDYTAEPNEDGTLAALTIKLDTMLTPSQNAQKFFKKYNKAKTAQIEKLKQKAINDEEIAFLESYQVYIAQAQTPDDINDLRDELIELGYIRRRKNQAKRGSPLSANLSFDLGDGLTLWIGRNNLENDKLTMKKAKKTDLWLHTKDIPGSHVILSGYKGEGGEAALSDPNVRHAAAAAAFYSKARTSEAVPVDFTLVKYVKKPSGAKPGMVIFTHNKTLYVDPKDPDKE